MSVKRKGAATGEPPASTWPVRSTGDDFWHRDAATTLQRFHAEKAVREYAAAKKWGEIRFRHVGELLREVPSALWSVTVRDLIADAVMRARLDVVSVAVTGKDVPLEESRPAVSSAKPEKLPKALRKIARPTARQTEAVAMLADVAAFLTDPPRLGNPLADLDTAAKRKAHESKRKLDRVRDDFAGALGKSGETFARYARKARTAPKKRGR